MDYMTLKEASEKWGVTPLFIVYLKYQLLQRSIPKVA